MIVKKGTRGEIVGRASHGLFIVSFEGCSIPFHLIPSSMEIVEEPTDFLTEYINTKPGQKKVSFTSLILRKPVVKEVVQVRDGDSDEWMDRVYIATIPGANYPFLAVCHGHEDKLSSLEEFKVTPRKEMRKKPIEEPVEVTMTDVCKKFGYNVKVVNG